MSLTHVLHLITLAAAAVVVFAESVYASDRLPKNWHKYAGGVAAIATAVNLAFELIQETS